MKSKKVKIVATLGPSIKAPEMIEKMAIAGTDVFRINLSHATRDEIENYVSVIRGLEKKLNKTLSIMGDLCGTKLRIGKIEENTVIETDGTIEISPDEVIGNKDIFSINQPKILEQVKSGMIILIDDGLIKLQVAETGDNGFVRCKIIKGGKLLPNKGFFVQDVLMENVEMTKKDIEDIKIMAEVNADAIAISFVQTERDVAAVRKLLPKESDIILISKIETTQALANIEKIIEASDGILIARGDLGLAVPIAQVPILQKKLINQCLKQAKPVITATQMLESMTGNSMPTRAEVTDVANAILDGTDAIMLSAETASGKFPVEAVEMMREIIKTTYPYIVKREFDDESQIPHAISSAAGFVAEKTHAKAIIVFTHSGFSALQVARHRNSHEVIVALSPNLKTLRKLNFCWGIYPKYIKGTDSFDHALEQAKEFITNNEIIKLSSGDPYVVVAGLPFNKAGTTNFVHIDKA